jgi:hypothetical protein
MSNVGPSPTATPPEIISHTSTQQWQSFEFRMRHRRAERCLLRAEMALDAGLDDDARDALDEAERLKSDSPKLAVLKSILAERAAASVVATEAAHQAAWRQRLLKLAAAAALFLAVGLGAYALTSDSSPAVAVNRAATSSSAPTPLAPAIEPKATTPAGAVATVGPSPAPAAVPALDGISAADTRAAETPRTASARPTLPDFNPQFADPRPVALPSASSTLDAAALRGAPAPSIPDPPPVILETPVEAKVVSDRPAVTIPLDRVGEAMPSSTVPVPERPVPDNPAVVEEPRVRAVLSRYEAAYSGLNAAAAQAVWPAVDERSLARAFDTLQSQQVSLGRCAVQVEGATASASCSGRITWTPKVGGGSQTAARQWRFELHSGNGEWQITRAEVR